MMRMRQKSTFIHLFDDSTGKFGKEKKMEKKKKIRISL
jgi:hypothetical protein